MKKCRICKNTFKQKKKYKRIYCSKYCREKYWRLHNKKHISNYAKKYRLNNDLLCRRCKNPIPKNLRHGGVVFCSDKCRKLQRSEFNSKYRNKAQILFLKFKESKGCHICGYNKFGGSLDFHHINPQEKEIRIQAKHWISNSSKIKNELLKCILLCKNCHYEEHWIMKHGNLPIYQE